MPPLVTKTIRLRKDQDNELLANFKGSSSFLFRELLDIFLRSGLPGIEIIKLRKTVKDLEEKECQKVRKSA